MRSAETPFGDPGPQPQAPALFHAPGSMPSDEELSAFMATVPVLPIPDYLRPGYESREVDG
jgi:hypothetical protein